MATAHSPHKPAGPRPEGAGLGWDLALVLGAFGGLLLLRGEGTGMLDDPRVETWTTMFISVVVQALPFLVLGIALSAAISTFVPPAALRRALPQRTAAAVPVAGAAGMLLPACECASVPVAAGLMRRGIPPAAAMAFLLAAPAINPIVLVSTAVAFPDMPEMVGARLVASFAVAIVVGWLWMRFGRAEWLRPAARPEPDPGAGRWAVFVAGAQHDLLHAGGFLVVGGITAATLNVAVPRRALDALGGELLLGVLCLAILAVLLAICSEADAFVAASLVAFPRTAQLAFMVVGPVVDVKLIALQAGTLGRRFALWFAPVTFGVAVLAALVVGTVLL